MRNNVKQESSMRTMSVVKKLREEAGLNQAQLAVAIGVAVSTISRWEQSGSKGIEPAMTPSEWLRFCRCVGIRWEDVPKYFIYQNQN